jgi:hypothetical protein
MALHIFGLFFDKGIVVLFHAMTLGDFAHHRQRSIRQGAVQKPNARRNGIEADAGFLAQCRPVKKGTAALRGVAAFFDQSAHGAIGVVTGDLM